MLESVFEDEPFDRSMLFGGRPIGYDETVLTPRPWTEAQSLWARGLVHEAGPGPVLELCAGAGQIGLLAVHGLDRRLVQVDSSLTACAWARRNALAWNVDSDIRHAPMDEALDPDERFPVILADPPWVPRSRVAEFPDDPLRAIDGGDDGLDVARTCLAVIAAHLTPHGRALLQVGALDQAHRLEAVAAEHGLRAVEVQAYPPGGVLVLLCPVLAGA